MDAVRRTSSLYPGTRTKRARRIAALGLEQNARRWEIKFNGDDYLCPIAALGLLDRPANGSEGADFALCIDEYEADFGSVGPFSATVRDHTGRGGDWEDYEVLSRRIRSETYIYQNYITGDHEDGKPWDSGSGWERAAGGDWERAAGGWERALHLFLVQVYNHDRYNDRLNIPYDFQLWPNLAFCFTLNIVHNGARALFGGDIYEYRYRHAPIRDIVAAVQAQLLRRRHLLDVPRHALAYNFGTGTGTPRYTPLLAYATPVGSPIRARGCVCTAPCACRVRAGATV